MNANAVQITIYPTEENIREGREGTFDCRARAHDGTTYPEVRWTRQGAPLPASAYETDGRLTFTSASPYDSGTYVCSTTYGGRNYEAYAQLNVLPCKFYPGSSLFPN
ncbi:unnamed protein product [Gongylonema pulchrum]|uniref:Ig-like domain-containing protein n=1 Tax=Gongylonema pulchrum TaxID=637853 RepID=A0A183CUA7_9BILA|nr:unnamed protein product [Gongylonema pulchrum]